VTRDDEGGPRPDTSWQDRPVHEPDGTRIGQVTAVEPDAAGGWWVEITADWGVIDILSALGVAGGAHGKLRLHSDELDDSSGKLSLRRELVAYRDRLRGAA
jgi:hypothetical protein